MGIVLGRRHFIAIGVVAVSLIVGGCAGGSDKNVQLPHGILDPPRRAFAVEDQPQWLTMPGKNYLAGESALEPARTAARKGAIADGRRQVFELVRRLVVVIEQKVAAACGSRPEIPARTSEKVIKKLQLWADQQTTYKQWYFTTVAKQHRSYLYLDWHPQEVLHRALVLTIKEQEGSARSAPCQSAIEQIKADINAGLFADYIY